MKRREGLLKGMRNTDKGNKWETITKEGKNTEEMQSTKVQTLGGLRQKYWSIWIENTFVCICIT